MHRPGAVPAAADPVGKAQVYRGINLVLTYEPAAQAVKSIADLSEINHGVIGGVRGVTAYRRQRVAEFAQKLASRSHELAGRAEEREAARLFNERFATAAGQLAQDAPAARLAGVYAMAGLADHWPQQRQTCVDALCAYPRMPYQPEPAQDAPAGGPPPGSYPALVAGRMPLHLHY